MPESQSHIQMSNPVRPRPVHPISTEFLAELQSAASMIMSREECAALEQELQQLRKAARAAA